MDEYGARRISNVEITELIKQDGRVCGAVGLPCPRRRALRVPGRGRGAVRAYRRLEAVLPVQHLRGRRGHAGFPCRGQAAQYGVSPALERARAVRLGRADGHAALRGAFLNGNGEDFMRGYSPKRGAKVDPHYNIRGMALEAREGRGPVWFDTSTMSEEGVRVMTPTGGWMLLNDQKLKKIGIDFFNMKTPWMPQLNNNFGGVAADTRCRTDVPGLYVAGARSAFIPACTWGDGIPASPAPPAISRGKRPPLMRGMFVRTTWTWPPRRKA